MRKLIAEFFSDLDQPQSMIWMDEDGTRAPHQFTLSPRRVLTSLIATMAAVILVVFASIALTPIREIIPGYGTTEIRRSARSNSIRLAELQDSLQTQTAYLNQLRNLITGNAPDSVSDMAEFTSATIEAEPVEQIPVAQPTIVSDRAQALLPIPIVDTEVNTPGTRYFAGIDFSMVTPVDGFITRPFDPRIEHYAVDVAVPEGTVVRSVADGYVIFADWTHEGGYALAIQHAKGYLSVYKHNQRLLKSVGERVRSHEPVAQSGNTGEVTTGPHLHFELWQNGLAQDPRRYFVAW